MFSTTDTIVAIATPPGRGGIGVVRLSGTDAHTIARRMISVVQDLEPRRATLTFALLKPEPAPAPGVSGSTRPSRLDQVIATFFPSPASYTGEDVVELSAHGSPLILRGIVESALAAGARLAEPGEFTLRAYLNGRIDLMQAEAVADLIDAVTPLQARAAFDQLQGTLTQAIGEIDAALFDLIARLEASVDFPEEGYHFADPRTLGAAIDDIISRVDRLLADAHRGRLLREGLQVAIVGPPNVGKSSLFNALVGASRAIVTDVPGTTRDLVTETVDLEGLRVTLVDTAGMRETTDAVESEGVARTRGAAAVADLLVVVMAPQDGNPQNFVAGPQHIDNTRLNVLNKCDLLDVPQRTSSSYVEPVRVSALTGEGLDELRRRIVDRLDVEMLNDRPAITNVRHIDLMERARESLRNARAALGEESLPEEFVLADLQTARTAFEEVTGKRTPEDLLEHIFSRFCIGK